MKALITGIQGQDGFYMDKLLKSKGYETIGIKRETVNLLDKDALFNLILNTMPDEIYNFAGYSNVFNPWRDIDNIFNINGKMPQYFLEAILRANKPIKFFQASSCLIFGRNTDCIQNENTPINPIHPYGIAKAYADNMIKEFRKVHNLFACSGIFYPHESPHRGDDFFTKKITNAIKEIKSGKSDTLKIGNLNFFRDYGYAPDYMEAAYLMMQAKEPKDYVIGTGNLISGHDFVIECFKAVGLDGTKYLQQDKTFYRENDTEILKADISKIKNDLGWLPTHSIQNIIKIMLQ